ncbi:MAG TPA: hypothetical protein VEB18_03360 [Candidatus Paceibacterota bacterium]|nr:hypothetical protein [Candidatus Paceibacterota bacterium]
MQQFLLLILIALTVGAVTRIACGIWLRKGTVLYFWGTIFATLAVSIPLLYIGKEFIPLLYVGITIMVATLIGSHIALRAHNKN